MKHAKFATILFVLGIALILSFWFWDKKQVENAFAQSSDSSGITQHIRIAVDSWVGYYPLCSTGLKRKLRESGYSLECIDDNADYKKRMKNLDNDVFDFVVATVDSYILNAKDVRYPGVIVAVLDESKGGDALIAKNGSYPSLDSFKSGQPKIALTPDSPSDYFAKSLSVHFDIDSLASNKNWRKEVEGSSAAWESLKSGQVDAAVLWEPDVNRALATKDFHKVIGTEQTQGLIVDILIASRQVSINQPEKITTFLKEYFKVLKEYRDDEALFISELTNYTGLSKKDVTNMLKGVRWVTLTENAEDWLAHSNQISSQEKLINSVNSVIEILSTYGDLNGNPFPNSDPYNIINSDFISNLYLKSSTAFFTSQNNSNIQSKKYAILNNKQWSNLREIGTLKVRAINFTSGNAQLHSFDKLTLDNIAENISHYPDFRIEVRGHSGIKGDSTANLILSQSRADTVVEYFKSIHNINNNRMRAIGFGDTKPLVKITNESSRSYHYRLPRVEVVLLGEKL